MRGQNGTFPEEVRALELMDLLDSCDALLDLHASNTPGSTPFVIAEPAAFAITEKLDFNIVSYGWDEIEPGAADGYMHRSGKIGICLECGYAADAEKNSQLAVSSAMIFLSHFGLIESPKSDSHKIQQLVHVHTCIMNHDDTLEFVREFEDFEPLPARQIFAKDVDREYRAEEHDCIIFQRSDAPIGTEACIIGSFQELNTSVA